MKKEETSKPQEPELPEKPHEKDKIKEQKQEYLVKTRDKIQLRFQVPKGKIANIMGVMNLLQSKFETNDTLNQMLCYPFRNHVIAVNTPQLNRLFIYTEF